ncbi:MAG: AEC family transporter [Immundisolibacteraceae bacterium]|nr:AEC family transporter [Immundisolibacteraceae bacterium]
MNSLAGAVDQALVPVMAVIFCGYIWRRLTPAGIDALVMRRVLGALVMYVTYPALAFSVITHADLDAEMLWVPGLTVFSIFVGALLGRLVVPLAGVSGRAEIGAVILACGFGNLISMGIPVVAAVFGVAASRYAIYADIMGLAPLLWTLGFWIALHFGSSDSEKASPSALLGRILKLPPIWAFFIALGFNLAGISLPSGIDKAADMVGQATMPCMLLTVGMSLSLASVRRYPRAIAVVAVVKLMLIPALVLLVGEFILGSSEMVSATVILAAMPTMMATIILSEEFGLNTELLATLMVGNTLLFFGTLPFWLYLLVA